MEEHVIMTFMLLWIFGLASTLAFASTISSPIIREYGPWNYINWYSDGIELYAPVGTRPRNNTSTRGVGVYTRMVHIDPRCSDHAEFIEACKMVYGTNRKELNMKFVPEFLK